VAVTLLGITGAVFLLARRGRAWWWLRVVPVTVGTILVTAIAVGFVDRVWRPFPDALPRPVIGWIAVAVAAVGLGVVRSLSAPAPSSGALGARTSDSVPQQRGLHLQTTGLEPR
jgi:hypothetical protein